jgi:hypothetical protein
MFAAVTVSLPLAAKFANATVVVPVPSTLIIEEDLIVLIISNGILF